MINKETASTPITKEELEAANIKQYSDNICYYYTTEIKHFDNGNNNTLGNMEFAIMRNNIYSLSGNSERDQGGCIESKREDYPMDSSL